METGLSLNQIYNTELTDAEFNKLSAFIYKEFGIKLPYAKKIMLQSRLHKRLKALNISTFKDYLEFVFSKEGQSEIIQMINVVSTNKTDFFRESAHFDFLRQQLLPQIAQTRNLSSPLKIWSAACSSGEEVYTIAITMEEFRNQSQRKLEYSIIGSDISTQVLQIAQSATYPLNRIDVIPLELKKKYFLKSKDPDKQLVRLIPDIRKRVSFQRLNFMDSSYNIGTDKFDIIFCRNVLIYFDKQTQERVINKLCDKLADNGVFFMGHSESLAGINAPLIQIQPTIFRKRV